MRPGGSKIELILLDIMMPVMDGFVFLHELRKTQKERSVPVVVVTAKDLTAEEMAELSGNVQEIFRKDEFEKEGILAEIGRLIKLAQTVT